MSVDLNINALGEMGFDSSLHNTIDSTLIIRKYYYIYITTDLTNSNQYVGFHSTDNLEDNYMGSGRMINEAILEKGVDNFSNEILEFCTLSNWKKRETFWIKEKNTKYPNGYNLTNGGEGVIGMEPWNKGLKNCYSEETKKKWSQFRKGRRLTPEAKKKLSDFNKGKIVSIKTKHKQSEAHKGSKNPMFGKPAWDSINNIRKTCEFCGVETNVGNYGRWHGQKCKYNI